MARIGSARLFTDGPLHYREFPVSIRPEYVFFLRTTLTGIGFDRTFADLAQVPVPGPIGELS